MLSSSKVAVAAIVATVAGVVSAAPNPTEPSSTSVFNVGGQCTVKWDVDATGTWKQMNIQLMTGDNWNMIPVTTVAQNIDATDATKNTFTYTCPEVTPTSAIYFYQFSSPANKTDLLWTTRWTMAGPNGETTPPTETTQPDGQKIAWGKGALVDPSKAVPPPAYLGGNQAASSTGTASGSVAVSSTVVVTTPVATSTSAGTSAAPSMSTARTTPVSSVGGSSRASVTGSATGTAASGAPSANAALGGAAPGVMAVVGALFAAVGMF